MAMDTDEGGPAAADRIHINAGQHPSPARSPRVILSSVPRVAVITPYYRESLEVLRHCHDSVRTQTFSCTHFMVADGHPHPEVSPWAVQHLILAKSHDDNGNTPRAIGSLSAMNQGFDAIAYLDADNWYYPHHIEAMIRLQQQTSAAVCTATRSIHRSDRSLMYIDRRECDGRQHVDTSNLFLTSAAYRLLSLWAMMPKQLGPICDNIFWQAIMARRISTAHHPEPTVAFQTQYAAHYTDIGEKAPEGTKLNADSTGRANRWWHSLPEEVRTDWRDYLSGGAAWVAPTRG
jgi:glycosyltransferase involved in cell wall biosynthesis